jgi:hypothetical protein
MRGEDCLGFPLTLETAVQRGFDSLRIVGENFQAFPIGGATSLVEPADTTTLAKRSR